MRTGSIFENDIKELDLRKAYKYLGIEENFDIQHKNEKGMLKKEYLRGLRLVLDTELSVKNKIQAIGSLAVLVLRYILGIINWRQEELQKVDRKNKETTNHSWIASPISGFRSLVCSRKRGRKGLDEVRSSPCSFQLGKSSDRAFIPPEPN